MGFFVYYSASKLILFLHQEAKDIPPLSSSLLCFPCSIHLDENGDSSGMLTSKSQLFSNSITPATSPSINSI
jgi:hypothetical protein